MQPTGFQISAARVGKPRQRRRVTRYSPEAGNSAFKIAGTVGHHGLLHSVGHASVLAGPQKRGECLAVSRASQGAFVSLPLGVTTLHVPWPFNDRA